MAGSGDNEAVRTGTATTRFLRKVPVIAKVIARSLLAKKTFFAFLNKLLITIGSYFSLTFSTRA
jgi:hypothetical protein